MAKYLKLFDTHAEYESFIQTDFDKPNVSYCTDNNEVHYNPIETRLICKYNVTSISEPTVLRADIEGNIFKVSSFILSFFRSAIKSSCNLFLSLVSQKSALLSVINTT